jgi:aryl-alcohol dehydrogenase-like predicted oxidoreductase
VHSRRIGKSDIEVSAIGFGCMGLSDFYTPLSDDQRRDVLRRALDLGVTHFDTADMYGRGENETLLGRELNAVRARLVIATKVGIDRSRGDAYGDARRNGAPAYLREACEAGLKRLRTDYVDILYLHRVDPAVPIEESVEAMSGLVRDGKARSLGLSKVDAATLARAERVHPITAVQMEYSLWVRGVEEEGLLDECRRRDIAVVAYSPLGKGLLARRFTSTESFPEGDWRRSDPAFERETLARKADELSALEALARGERCTLAQFGLAWLLSRGPDVLPIPGMRTVAQVEENVGAAAVCLSPQALAAVSRVQGEARCDAS